MENFTQSVLRCIFEPVEQVEWRLVFHEKQFEDTVIDLFHNASPIPGNFIL